MRLSPGTPAPSFSVTDFNGSPVSLSDFRGRKLLLSFYRYASCPFCNLRMHEMRQRSAGWKAQGLDIVAVFQSPADSIREYAVGETVEFPVIPDPERQLYALYGTEASWLAFAKSAVRAKDMLSALTKGFMPGKMEGEISQVPADFLIDENGIIRTAYYGADIGDHLPTEQIEAFLAKR
ncbi:MAG: peroxiredoxin-like family protein [Gammaproteobacteria bacterium]